MAAIPSHAKPASTWATYSFQNQHPSGKMTIRVNRKWSSEHTLSQFCLGSSLAGGVNHLPGWPTITHSAHAPRLSLHVFIYLWFTLSSIKSSCTTLSLLSTSPMYWGIYGSYHLVAGWYFESFQYSERTPAPPIATRQTHKLWQPTCLRN